MAFGSIGSFCPVDLNVFWCLGLVWKIRTFVEYPRTASRRIFGVLP